MKPLRFYSCIQMIFLLTAGLASYCTQKEIVSPASLGEQQITHFRRADPSKEAILFGHIDLLSSKSKKSPLPAAIISLDEKLSFANDTGDYSLALPQGVHQFMTEQIGVYQSRLVLKIDRGDSIRINFNLRPDLRPIIN